ncbi:hypothetical protein ISCGN_009810 [Ixodes scapularis]
MIVNKQRNSLLPENVNKLLCLRSWGCDLRALPETVKAGYLNCRIRPYIPNPQRCFRCQRFGHGSRSCRGKETCAKCGNEGHVSDGCEAEAHCANCRGPHPAYYRSCPLWKQEKDILAIKVKENLSYADAKKRFSFLSKGGYAEVVRRGPAPRSETKATQVSPEILVADLKAPSPQQRQHAAPLGKYGPAIAVPALPFKTVARGSVEGTPTVYGICGDTDFCGRPVLSTEVPSEPLKVTHTQSPSCSEGAVPSKEGTTPPNPSPLPSKEGRGRGLSSRASCSHLKPRRTEQPPPPPKGPTLSPDEKMDESLPLSEDDQSLPETESPPLVSSEVVGRPKDTYSRGFEGGPKVEEQAHGQELGHQELQLERRLVLQEQ